MSPKQYKSTFVLIRNSWLKKDVHIKQCINSHELEHAYPVGLCVVCDVWHVFTHLCVEISSTVSLRWHEEDKLKTAKPWLCCLANWIAFLTRDENGNVGCLNRLGFFVKFLHAIMSFMENVKVPVSTWDGHRNWPTPLTITFQQQTEKLRN